MTNKTLGNLLIAVVVVSFLMGFVGNEPTENGYVLIGLILVIWGGIRLRKSS